MRLLLVIAVVLLGILAVAVNSPNAAEKPGKLPLGVYDTPMELTPSGGQQLQCGTYAGNQSQNTWMYYLNQAQQLQRGSSAPPSFIEYDDVWVVENDGSLAFTGINAGDLNLLGFRFTPNAGGYDVTSIPFALDGVFGTNLGLTDDGNQSVNLQFSFPFYGTNWSSVEVNANGAVAFGAIFNPSGFFDNDEFFSQTPKIALYFMDLNPSAGGSVHHKAEATKSTFTWSSVPEFGTITLNTLQMVIYDDGRIEMFYPGTNTTVAANGAPITVGIHPGGSPSLDLIDITADVPHSGGNLTGIYELFYNYSNPLVNEVGLFQFFYQNYADVFFQLNFFTTFSQTMAGFANELNISNDVTGIGLGIFDNSGLYGSNGILESRCNMNQMNVWPLDPTNRFFSSQNNFLTIMGQEAGHRWGAFMFFQDSGGQSSNLILGRSNAHWSYYVDVDHSSLEGGNWEFVSGNTYTTPTMIDFFGDIDEYTFGLRTAEEVTETFYVSSTSNNTQSARSQGTPVQFANATGTAVTVTIDDIIAEEGPRTPTFDNENKDLRQAFILLHQAGNPPTQQQLDQIAGFRRAWEDYFELSCDGRITCNTRLSQELPVAVLEGNVIDELYFTPVLELTATLVDRGFIQFVHQGGRYHFRCMPDTTTPPAPDSCCVTVMLEAPGYETKTVDFCLPYGETTNGDVRMRPIPTGIGDQTPLAGAELRQNYPNPFNPETMIEYSISEAADVRLELYDVHGRLVRTLVNERKEPGVYQTTWNGRDTNGELVGSGVYFARLQTAEGIMNRKIVMLK